MGYFNYFLCGFVCCLVYFFYGCRSKMTPADEGVKQGILIVANSSEPQSLDPHKTIGAPENDIMRSLFEGLVWLNPKDFSAIPGVAHSWEISNDGLQYVFHLRHDAKWSDGLPLTAYDFLKTYERALSPITGALITESFFCIKNAHAFAIGEIRDFNQVGIQAVDAYTLKIDLDYPNPYFLSGLANSRFAPLPMHVIEKYGDTWQSVEHFVSNGPFILSYWGVNDAVFVKKNPYYWDADHVLLNGVKFLPITDQQTEEKAFLSGQLHKTFNLEQNRVKYYLNNHSSFLRMEPLFSTEYIACCTKHPVISDKRIRQALSLSLSRDILRTVFSDTRTPAYTFIPPGFGFYQSPFLIEENVAKAQQLLAEAGYPNGKGFPKIKLLFNAHAMHQLTYQVVQNMWKERLNIEIELVAQEWKSYLENRMNSDYALSRHGWIADDLDPATFLTLYSKDAPANSTGWSNFAFENALYQAHYASGLNERNSYYQQAEIVLRDEMPVIPLLTSSYYYLLDQRVKGVIDNGMHYHMWHTFYFDGS